MWKTLGPKVLFLEKEINMLKRIIILLAFAGSFLPSQGRAILDELDLSSGRWELIGVSLTNYNLQPIQLDLGTFIVKEAHVLRKMQEQWVFEEKFDDYCDYHYALKFYKDGELMQTIRVNLVCDYASVGGLSYNFSMEDFMEFRPYYRPIRWSRIRFQDFSLLQKSVDVLDEAPDVYWYGDVQQYNFEGEFSITINDLPWNANRDSMIAVVSQQIQDKMGRDDFYVTTKYWLISEDLEHMTLRLNVFCNEAFYKAYAFDNVITRWRSHFSEQSFIQIVVIGMSQSEYFKYMRRS